MVWPSRSRIAERCGIADLNEVSRATTKLVELGWLVKEGKGGYSKSCRYRVTIPDYLGGDEEEEQDTRNDGDTTIVNGEQNDGRTTRGPPGHTTRGKEEDHFNSTNNKYKGGNVAQQNESSNRSVKTRKRNRQPGDPMKSTNRTVNERTKELRPVAKRLARIIQSDKDVNIPSRRITEWANEIRKLVEVDGISHDRLDRALDWYAKNIGGEYVPVVESGSTLRKKFLRLEAAVERSARPPKKANGLEKRHNSAAAPKSGKYGSKSITVTR
jgi:hypothetical protein